MAAAAAAAAADDDDECGRSPLSRAVRCAFVRSMQSVPRKAVVVSPLCRSRAASHHAKVRRHLRLRRAVRVRRESV